MPEPTPLRGQSRSGTTRTERDWKEEARAMKAADPSLSNGEIGSRLGRTRSAVWKALNPERTSELRRAENAKRQPIKNEWQNKADRTATYRAVCESCGGLCGIGSGRSRQSRLCVSCIARRHEERCQKIEALWAEGVPIKEMTVLMGVSRHGLNELLSEMRKSGRLPYRYRAYQEVENAA